MGVKMKTKFVAKVLGCLMALTIGCGTPVAVQHHALAGDPCGNGNVVCGGTTVCTQAADCIPPCLVSGVPVYRSTTTSTCEARGLITTADGRCVVPCWYELCDVLGGTCF